MIEQNSIVNKYLCKWLDSRKGYHWWFARVTLGVAIGFLIQILGDGGDLHIITTRKWSYWAVMFLHLSVSHSVHMGEEGSLSGRSPDRDPSGQRTPDRPPRQRSPDRDPPDRDPQRQRTPRQRLPRQKTPRQRTPQAETPQTETPQTEPPPDRVKSRW